VNNTPDYLMSGLDDRMSGLDCLISGLVCLISGLVCLYVKMQQNQGRLEAKKREKLLVNSTPNRTRQRKQHTQLPVTAPPPLIAFRHDCLMPSHISGLDCLVSGLDCLISGLDYLISCLDCLISSLECLISGLDCRISSLDCPISGLLVNPALFRQTGILLPNNQHQHRTSHAPKDVLPLRTCANYCSWWTLIPPPFAIIPCEPSPERA